MTLDAGDAMWVGSAETRTAFLPRTKVSAGGMLARLVEGGGLPTKVLPCLPACVGLGVQGVMHHNMDLSLTGDSVA